jgi:hypothetical protein
MYIYCYQFIRTLRLSIQKIVETKNKIILNINYMQKNHCWTICFEMESEKERRKNRNRKIDKQFFSSYYSLGFSISISLIQFQLTCVLYIFCAMAKCCSNYFCPGIEKQRTGVSKPKLTKHRTLFSAQKWICRN